MRSGLQRILFAPNYPRRWGLVSHWKLDEASGTRADSHGSNHLTDNNTVTQGTGKVGSAAQFTAANSESLSVADSASVSTGNVDFWLAAWVNIDSLAAVRAVVGKDASGQREFLIYVNPSGSVEFIIYDSAGTTKTATTPVAAVTTGSWFFLLAWHDSVNDTVNIRVNNGTVFSTATAALVVNDSTTPLEIGARTFVGSRLFMDGKIDEVSLGKSPPGGIAGVVGEIHSRLYKEGTGRSYPFI